MHEEYQELLASIAPFKDRPFREEVVQHPWQKVVDVPSLHGAVKQEILKLVRTCHEPTVPRCVTVIGPTGYGKSHVLAWTRQQLDEEDRAVFVSVQPQFADSAPLSSHLIRAVIDSLWHSSDRQRRLFQRQVQSLLVNVYNEKVRNKKWLHIQPKKPAAAIRWFFASHLEIADEHSDENLRLLQTAMQQPAFLDSVYRTFVSKNGPDPAGARIDRDALIAACQLACGNQSQRLRAEKWFQDRDQAEEDRQMIHVRGPCRGAEKVCNVLFTLSRLIEQNLCLAFDQLEDTFNNMYLDDASRKALNEMMAMITLILCIPRVCLVFMFQKSIWSKFSKIAPQHFLDRLREGHGIQELRSLDQKTACELVRVRMREFVWQPLGREPPENKLFPFNEEEIAELRRESHGELRAFLQLMRDRLLQRLAGVPYQKRQLPPIQLTKIEPNWAIHNDRKPVVIHATNLPRQVKVFFGKIEAEKVNCQADNGEIHMVAPESRHGPVQVRVMAADDSDERETFIRFQFAEREPLRPYSKTISRQKLQRARNDLGLTQAEVARQIGYSSGYMSQLENGRNNPPDRVFEQLAEIYQVPLSDLVIDPPSMNKAA